MTEKKPPGRIMSAGAQITHEKQDEIIFGILRDDGGDGELWEFAASREDLRNLESTLSKLLDHLGPKP